MEPNNNANTKPTGGRSPAGVYGVLAEPAELSVMRVNQLDAGVLDTELHSLLKTQLGRACSGLPAGTLERFKPEVDALFNLLMFRFTVWVHRPTPGMHLQGLRYRSERGRTAGPPSATATGGSAAAAAAAAGGSSPLASGWEGGEGGASGHGGPSNTPEGVASSTPTFPGLASTAPLPYWGDAAPTRAQRLVHGLLSVGVQWGFARLRRHGLVHGWGGEDAGSARRVAWHVLGRLETLFRVAWMVNLLLFLKSGKYATPVDRLVRMRMVHDRADPGPRPINYQFLNRRLLWDHWAKMAYVVAPLINWGSVRRAVSGGAGRLRREARALGVFGGSSGGAGRVSARGLGADAAPAAEAAAAEVVLTACAECGANPAKTPYVTGCGHVFCYYCARVACTVDPRYACPRCGEYFATSRRWSQPR
ncbi:unnamed protein product [Ectocarpus sp. 6 AP-2014]